MGTVIVSFFLLVLCDAARSDDCFDIDDSDKSNKAWRYLGEMKGQKVTVKDANFNSTYTLGVCTNVGQSNNNAGVIEHTQLNETIVVGRINSSSVMKGSHWILLTYGHGDAYDNETCGNSNRQAALMFICDHEVENFDRAKIIDENLNRQTDCYHLFEIEHCLACIEDGCAAFFPRLSPGSWILVGLFSLCSSYLIIGWFYQRCVVKQRGWRQIPNALFWQEIGHLQADGCAYACKCGTRPDDEYYQVVGGNSRNSLHGQSLLSDDEDLLLPR